MKQRIALSILKSGGNVFLTGSAGTGKTYIVNKYIDYLQKRGICPAVVAPTGIAASHIGGKTIHSFFGIGIKEYVDDEYLKQLTYRKFLRKRLSELKVLIIDEISMVSPEIFNSVDKILRFFRYSEKPFGGIQIVLSGDFFQLPPVSTTKKEVRFVWQTDLWEKTCLNVCYLEEKFRQTDPVLINILDEIRSGEVSENSMKIFRSCFKKDLNIDFSPTRLYTHNIDVNEINKKELNKIRTNSRVFKASSRGVKKNVKKIFKTTLAIEELILKKGAVVIFIKNNYERGYINGTLGKVVGFSRDGDLPIVKTLFGGEILVKPEEWRIENDDGNIEASVRQIPLRLAWALTIHKAQGMSLDVAEVDLSKTFEVGQGYVALSRIKSIDGLRLMGLNDIALQVDEDVLNIDNEMKENSQQVELTWKDYSKREKTKIFDRFITYIGGIKSEEMKSKNKERGIEKNKIKKNISNVGKNRQYEERRSTIEITKKLLLKKFDIKKIAQKRNISKDTIYGHIKKIKDLIPNIDIDFLRPSKKIMKSVHNAIVSIQKRNRKEDFLEDGTIRLKAIFEYLGKKIAYDDIKLALLFENNKNLKRNKG